jgi:hypothetical protein
MLFFVLSAVCLAGCSSGEKPVAMINTSDSLTVDETLAVVIPDGEDVEKAGAKSEVVLAEKPVADAVAIDEIEIEPDAVAVSDSKAKDIASAPVIESGEPAIDVEPVVKQTDQRPLLTREVIDAYVQLGQKRDDADKLLFEQLSNMGSAYNLRATAADIYESIINQIDIHNQSEIDHATKFDSPVPIDMKIGRPTAGHRVRGVSLPSMRLGLLKYLIDRARESEEFDIDSWLDRTQEIEKKLSKAVDPVFEKDKFSQLFEEIDGARDMWAYTNSRVREMQGSLNAGFSLDATGRAVFHQFGGIQGLSKRAGTRAGLIHNLERLKHWRTTYEYAKLEIDLLMGEAFHEALSEADREHLEGMWGAQVLLSPRIFFRTRWQSQYATDLEIVAASKAIRQANEDSKAEKYIERAKLFARKGTQPYMVYADLRQAKEFNPKTVFDLDMQQKLDTAVATLVIEDKRYTPTVMMELYFDSLRLVDHE